MFLGDCVLVSGATLEATATLWVHYRWQRCTDDPIIHRIISRKPMHCCDRRPQYSTIDKMGHPLFASSLPPRVGELYMRQALIYLAFAASGDRNGYFTNTCELT